MLSSYFQGLGKRRVPNSTYQFKNDFIAWMPEREYIERSRPLASTYKLDFMEEKAKSQLITKRPKTSFDGVATTSYRYSHGEAAPNKQTINAMNNTALKLSLLNRKDRAMTAMNRGRESVASCMTWVSSKTAPAPTSEEPVRPNIPLATQTTQFVPHPPTEAKPPSPKTSPPPQQQQQAWPMPEQQAPAPMAQVPPPCQQAPPQQAQPMAT